MPRLHNVSLAYLLLFICVWCTKEDSCSVCVCFGKRSGCMTVTAVAGVRKSWDTDVVFVRWINCVLLLAITRRAIVSFFMVHLPSAQCPLTHFLPLVKSLLSFRPSLSCKGDVEVCSKAGEREAERFCVLSSSNPDNCPIHYNAFYFQGEKCHGVER